MKAFLWLLTLALIVICLTGWAMSEVVEQLLNVRGKGTMVPSFSRLVILLHNWILAVPWPWVAYAGLLSFRRELKTNAALLFAGTLILAAVLLACSLTVALTLPFILMRA